MTRLAPTHPNHHDDAGNGANGGRLAIVIDDEAMVLKGLTLVLEQLGWTVLPAESAEDALRQLNGSGRCPAMIIADYRLRGGRTGVEAIRALHGIVGSGVPALLLTGDTSPDRLRDALSSGYTLLHKPVSFGELNSQLMAAQAR